MRALSKYRGALCVVELTMAPCAMPPQCPDCRSGVLSHVHCGWLECDACDFALLVSDLERGVADIARKELEEER